jgi:cytochrome c-L
VPWFALPGALSLSLTIATTAASEEGVAFRSAFDNRPLHVPVPAGALASEAVGEFHRSGRNLYSSSAAAIGKGKRLYETWCQGCHMPNGAGRIGPSLIGTDFLYERVSSDVGMFEVIYGGAGGAMQSFSTRIAQDDMLMIIAYVRSLSAAARNQDQ